MTPKTNRLVLGAVAVAALTAGTSAPAMADDYRDRGGIGAGEIIAGAVVIGGIAALAGAFDDDRDDRRYASRERDYRGSYGGGGGPRAAVERCVRAAENQARRSGGYRYADVVDVRDVDRTRNGFRVKGRIAVEGSPRWGGRRSDHGNFTCRIDGRGAPLVDYSGIRGLR